MNTTHTSGQLVKFLGLLEEKGSNTDTFQIRLGNGILADIFDPNAIFPNRDEWRKLLGLGPLLHEVLPLTVDYNQTQEQMVAAGRYDWKNSDLTEKRFPVEGVGIVQFEARLRHPNKTVSSEQVLKEINEADLANPWEPAKTEHILAFGAKYPEEQRKFPIVGLGSVARVYGDRVVPVLGKDGSGRYLALAWFDGGWNAYYRFLEVRKASATPALSPQV